MTATADTTVYYYADLHESYHDDIGEAFDEWSWCADIDYVEVLSPGEANLLIGWADLTGGLAVTKTNGTMTKIAFDWAASGNFYEVALHEIGHALGLPHDDEADAVMNTHGGSDSGHLTDLDVADIQALYGPSCGWAYGWYESTGWSFGWHHDDAWAYGWHWSSSGWLNGWYEARGWAYGWYEATRWSYGWHWYC